jgi:hypothetical protein
MTFHFVPVLLVFLLLRMAYRFRDFTLVTGSLVSNYLSLLIGRVVSQFFLTE